MRVQDSSSGQLLPVWQTLKGLSRHGRSTPSSPDSASASTSPPNGPIWSVSEDMNPARIPFNAQASNSQQGDSADSKEEGRPNGMVSKGPKAFFEGNSGPSLPTLVLPDASTSSSTNNLSPHTSTSSLLATPSPCFNKTFPPPFPSPRRPSTYDNELHVREPNDVKICIPTSVADSDVTSTELCIASMLGGGPGTDSSSLSRRASRNNSVAVLPTFPIPTVTQLNNTAAVENIGTEGPDAPNVFR